MVKTINEGVVTTNTSYVEWGPVIAGAIVTLSITSVLTAFGHGIGFSMDAPINEQNARGVVFSIGLWIFWTQLISSIIGGYFAGKATSRRLGDSEYESEFRDGTHGLLAWASGTVFTVIGLGFASLIAAIAPEAPNEVVVSETLARQTAVIFGFSITASSIISAAVAWIVATVGGDHRDENVDLSRYLSFRKQKPLKTRKK